jgi:hypothetical protein
MKKRCLALVLACVCLTGCTPLLERSYASVTPHVQFSDEAASVLRAESYQGLVSALLHLVEQGKEEGVIRLYQYASVTGTAASDVDGACLEVTQEDPLGAYAVDYIKYTVDQTAAYYQIEVKLAYTRTQEEIRSITSVTGSNAIAEELREMLPDTPDQAVFRISYFTSQDSDETIRQSAWDAYEELADTLPPLEDVTVILYPQTGPQRVAQLAFTWGQQEDQTGDQTGQENGKSENQEKISEKLENTP